MSDVFEFWRTSPLTVALIPVVRVADFVRRHQIRSERAEVVAGFAEQPLLRAQLQIAGRQIVDIAIAEHIASASSLDTYFGFLPMTMTSSAS